MPLFTTTPRLEHWNALTHSLGLGASIVGLSFLFVKATTLRLDSWQWVSLVIYSVALIGLYAISTLFHSLFFTAARPIFQRLDHSMIFILIAGTYTPYCALFLPTPTAIPLLGWVWGLSLLGVVGHWFQPPGWSYLETGAYIVLGWLCLTAGTQFLHALGPLSFSLLVSGGVTFTLGAAIYRFVPLRTAHIWWHLAVILGTSFMLSSIYISLV